jgi:cytochrome c biogenesis factor
MVGVSWGVFLLSRTRRHQGVFSILVIAVIVVVFLFLISQPSKDGLPKWMLTAQLVTAALLLIVVFAWAYWSYGATSNFTVKLSHLDAIYFAVGTLSTAGTGNIAAKTDVSRGLQTAEMIAGMVLILFAVSVFIARFVRREEAHRMPVGRVEEESH